MSQQQFDIFTDRLNKKIKMNLYAMSRNYFTNHAYPARSSGRRHKFREPENTNITLLGRFGPNPIFSYIKQNFKIPIKLNMYVILDF